MNIQRMYGRVDTKGYKSKHGETPNLPLPDWLVGIELEIEGWDNNESSEFGGIKFTEDGSLRANNKGVGIEAITLPVAIKHVPAMLKAFFNKFEVDASNYSERCSTHVHFNVEPLEFSQVATISLVYQTVEQLLFNFVGHGRDNNIFCVPWNQCNLSYNIVNKIEQYGNEVFRRWQKYSALNLIPISTQGTVEFRHLYGTCDVSLITNWVCLLAKIMEYAQKVDLFTAQQYIIQMNTVSNYHEWMHSVFGEYMALLQMPNFETALSRGVIDSKLMIMKTSVNKRDIQLDVGLDEAFTEEYTVRVQDSVASNVPIAAVNTYAQYIPLIIGNPIHVERALTPPQIVDEMRGVLPQLNPRYGLNPLPDHTIPPAPEF